VTIKDVAMAAGVSAQTVSRVLNERPDVSPETSRRVRAIIRDVGYSPNLFARSLTQGRSQVLGVVAYGLDYFGPSRILTGIDRMAGALGYTISLDLIHQPETTQVGPLLTSLVARQVDGIIWAIPPVGLNRSWARNGSDHQVPIVLVGGPDASSSLTSISIDNREIGRIATDHLLDTGARRIGIVTGPAGWWEAVERKAGWTDALVARGMTPDETLVVEGDWTPESGRRGLDRLIDRGTSIDAVFASNDQMAVGVLHAAHVRGLHIPDDLSVVGVDDIAESPHYWPPLTTVDQPLREAGSLAVEAIVQALARPRMDDVGEVEPTPIPSTVLRPRLIVRESTRGRASTRT
jgi:LacI family transcriptional regulator